MNRAAGAPIEETIAEVVPRVWLLVADKGGDNAQAESVVQALEWPFERKRIQMREPYVIGKPRVKASLYHVDLSRSDILEPPWPDLVVTIGRRLSMVALWIGAQSAGRTKTVLLGKPSGMMQHFDLVVGSAIAQMPPLPNVFQITLPLTYINEVAVADAAALWRPRWADLPRPLIALLVGGPTNPFVFDDNVTDRIIDLTHQIVGMMGGTAYVTTSRRTPARLVSALQARLPPGAHLFRWAPSNPDNPYLALLELADGFVVTGDSMTMMVEVARMRKPLAIFTLPLGGLGRLDQARRATARLLFAPATCSPLDRPRQMLASALFRLGLVTYTRDFAAFYELLINRGLAVRAGEGFPPPSGEVPDDLALVVARIKALFDVEWSS